MRRKLREIPNETAAARLRQAGLRPTRQRNELAKLLFRNGHRHLTAEALHAEAVAEGIKVSLATVYNALHQFTQAGLLLQVVVDPTRSYFDTNTVYHQHFYHEDEAMLLDIPGPDIAVDGLPTPPPGTEIQRVDVVVRLRKH
ncbi:MAG: iron response transcriptional regulator IrrA [Rhizomicrobium sp.]|jgi:Fur family iron response transcriptional regulator